MNNGSLGRTLRIYFLRPARNVTRGFPGSRRVTFYTLIFRFPLGVQLFIICVAKFSTNNAHNDPKIDSDSSPTTLDENSIICFPLTRLERTGSFIQLSTRYYWRTAAALAPGGWSWCLDAKLRETVLYMAANANSATSCLVSEAGLQTH